MLGTYLIFSFTTVLFRASSIKNAGNYFQSMFENTFWKVDHFILEMFYVILVFQAFEWFMQYKDHQFEVSKWPAFARRSAYVFLILVTLLYGYFGEAPFYYFQF